MSATELRERLAGTLEREIQAAANRALGLAAMGTKVTAEQVAFAVLEANAYRRGLEDALGALTDEYKKLVAPDSIPSGASEEDEVGDRFYQ